MQIYNTLTKKKEELVVTDNTIKMFVCGPTVYDYIHIGNARTFVIFDAFAKYLRHLGYNVHYIQNITDIDDKIIKRAEEAGEDPMAFSAKFAKIFKADMESLGVSGVTYAPASEYIPAVIEQVKQLIEKGHAYLIEGDGYYFDLSTFPEYGKLSGRSTEMAEDAVSRIDDNPNKRNRGDFCVWKFSKEDEPIWSADFGPGRPGWHIEDTAITAKLLGTHYDIHGGASDLIFPHHEAEIAQMESINADGQPFVNYWIHSGFLVNKSAKMSKSLGNFLTLHEARQKYSTEALRFYFLSNHYRAPLDFNDQSLNAAEAAVSRIDELIYKLASIQNHSQENILSNQCDQAEVGITEALDDDFNTPKAFATLFDFIRNLNIVLSQHQLSYQDIGSAMKIITIVDNIFGIVSERGTHIPSEIQALITEREQARQNKDFTTADALRNQIKNLGYEVEDTVYGPLVKKL